MAKAQKRGNKEARKPKKVEPKAAAPLAADKNAVKLTVGKRP
jgi:hypothetical protein